MRVLRKMKKRNHLQMAQALRQQTVSSCPIIILAPRRCLFPIKAAPRFPQSNNYWNLRRADVTLAPPQQVFPIRHLTTNNHSPFPHISPRLAGRLHIQPKSRSLTTSLAVPTAQIHRRLGRFPARAMAGQTEYNRDLNDLHQLVSCRGTSCRTWGVDGGQQVGRG